MAVNEYTVNAMSEAVTMPKETYFRFLFLPKFLNGRNAVSARASSTRFFRNVWKLVR